MLFGLSTVLWSRRYLHDHRCMVLGAACTQSQGAGVIQGKFPWSINQSDIRVFCARTDYRSETDRDRQLHTFIDTLDDHIMKPLTAVPGVL